MKILITPHAVGRYQQRIHNAAPSSVEAEITAALSRPLFTLDIEHKKGPATLWGLINRSGFPFLALTDRATEKAPYLLVKSAGPAWYWREARQAWKESGFGRYVRGSKKGYREKRRQQCQAEEK